jgi:hypothetical protein
MELSGILRRDRGAEGRQDVLGQSLENLMGLVLHASVRSNARVQRADDEAPKYALYLSRSRCNEMLGGVIGAGNSS